MEGNENADSFLNSSDLQGITSIRGFVVDYSSKLLGVPRLRQQRIPVDWKVGVYETFHEWYPNNVYGNIYFEDENDYIPNWEPYNPKVRKLSQKEIWWHMNKYESDTGEFQGKTGRIYKGTGYPIDLYWSHANSTWKVTDLATDEWIDNRTRVAFLEINLYNVNSNLFTAITVVSEVLPSGLLSAKLSVETTSIQFSSSANEMGILILTCVVVLILIVNVINTMYYLSRKGFTNYIANWSGLNNLALTGVGLWFIYVFFTRFLYFVLFSDKLDASPKDVHTSLYPAFNYNFYAHCVTGCFVIVITSIAITRIHGLIGYSKFKKALDLTKYTLIVLFIIILLFSYLIAALSFFFGTMYIERLAVIFILRAIPLSIMEHIYHVRIGQIILYLGLIVFILVLFNKASQIYYYQRASALFKKEISLLTVMIAGDQKEKDENRLRERLEKQVSNWKNRRKRSKKGGASEEDAWARQIRRGILRFSEVESLGGRRPLRRAFQFH